MDLHPNCAPLAFLLGTWRGSGRGSYPSIDSFAYVEEVVFGHVGKPFLTYAQKTRHQETDAPLHAETGYLRCSERGAIELVVAQPTGIVELHTGTVEGSALDLSLDKVCTTPTAKSVTDVVRKLRVINKGSQFHYTVAMAAEGHPLQHHLEATLDKVLPS